MFYHDEVHLFISFLDKAEALTCLTQEPVAGPWNAVSAGQQYHGVYPDSRYFIMVSDLLHDTCDFISVAASQYMFSFSVPAVRCNDGNKIICTVLQFGDGNEISRIEIYAVQGKTRFILCLDRKKGDIMNAKHKVSMSHFIHSDVFSVFLSYSLCEQTFS